MAQFGHAIHPQPRLLVHIRLAKGGWKVVVAYPLCSLRGGQTTTGQTKAWLAASKVDSSRVSKRLAGMKAEQSLSATIVPPIVACHQSAYTGSARWERCLGCRGRKRSLPLGTRGEHIRHKLSTEKLLRWTPACKTNELHRSRSSNC